ncbi:MAG: type I-U CRISPR-associated helicase/endonuclease Cas3, partial [Chloracidobacterium sp.]
MTTSDQELLKSALGEKPPFPWQLALLQRFRNGPPVSSLDIPTGLGKTAVMAVWLVARALRVPVPRRLVYVVDRRAVVDQATEVAESLRQWVGEKPDVAQQLGLGNRPLPISTLRGQHIDNREWLEDPSLPAIIVGTVDMVGSRLLFSGYGVSPKMRPYHAGLIGVDTLIVLDEAHLVPAFEDLLRQIEQKADQFGPKDHSLARLVPPFKLLSLSATGRQTNGAALTLSDKDRDNSTVNQRLTAKKKLTIFELTKADSLTEILANEAWKLTDNGSQPVRCLVFCDTRRDAIAVAAKLRDKNKPPIIELFVGARRVFERAKVAEWLVKHGFMERKDGTRTTPPKATFLVATSAGEVGVDLDADHLVCDLVTWERMVQRLGRVNRRGDGDAKVVVVMDAGFPDEDELRAASQSRGDNFPRERKRTLDLFDKRKKANEARTKLKQTNLSASESKA